MQTLAELPPIGGPVVKTGSSLHKRIVETSPDLDEIIPAARAGRCKDIQEVRLLAASDLRLTIKGDPYSGALSIA